MKKAYTITPEKYKKNRETICDIKRKYNYPQESGWRYLDGTTADDRTPEKVKEQYKKAVEENKTFVKPKNDIFLSNTDIYNLWLNRDTDEPITARELYNIVSRLLEEIEDAEDRAESSAIWSNWDGR